MNKLFFLLFTFFTLSLSAQDYTLVKDAAVVQKKIMESNKASQTLQAEFTQEKHMSILNKPFISTGQFFYKQPDKVRWEYRAPFSYVVILVNNHVTIKDGEDLQNYDMSKNAIFKEVNRVMSGMVSGRMLEDKNFENVIYENSKNYKVTLLPKMSSVKGFIEEIHLFFDKDSSQMLKVVMFEKEGDKTIINFKNTKINLPINDNVFQAI